MRGGSTLPTADRVDNEAPTGVLGRNAPSGDGPPGGRGKTFQPAGASTRAKWASTCSGDSAVSK